MKQEQQLRDAIELSISQGLEVIRGPLFTFGIDNKIIGVDAIGAFLLKEKFKKIHFESGWLKEAGDLLDVDSFWLYRFWMGWDRRFQILVENTNKGGYSIFSEDEVAKLGIKLSKQYAK